MTFCELKQKDVINICDGRRLGKPIDLALNDSACVSALIVPGPSGFLNCLRAEREGDFHSLGTHSPHWRRRNFGGIGRKFWKVSKKTLVRLTIFRIGLDETLLFVYNINV